MVEPSPTGRKLEPVTDATVDVAIQEQRARAAISLNARLKMIAGRLAIRPDRGDDFASYAFMAGTDSDSPPVLREMMDFFLDYHQRGALAVQISNPEPSRRTPVRIRVGQDSRFRGGEYVDGEFIGVLDAARQQDDEFVFDGVAMIDGDLFAVNLRPRQGDNAPDISIDPRHLEHFDEPAHRVIESLFPPSRKDLSSAA